MAYYSFKPCLQWPSWSSLRPTLVCCNLFCYLKCKVLMVMRMMMLFSWVLTLCRLAGRPQRFWETYCLSSLYVVFQISLIIFYKFCDLQYLKFQNFKAGEPSPVSCLWQTIQHICSYPPCLEYFLFIHILRTLHPVVIRDSLNTVLHIWFKYHYGMREMAYTYWHRSLETGVQQIRKLLLLK
jgi:hypothetical protein